MASDFKKALDAEIEEIEYALRRDSRYVKLVELKRVKAIYANAPLMGPIEASMPAVAHAYPEPNRSEVQPRKRSGSPERLAILNRAKEFISGKREPTPTIDIFEAVSAQIDIPGANPRNNLSAMLSNSNDFKSHGRSGWTLVESQEASGALNEELTPEASVYSASPAETTNAVRPVDPWLGDGA